MSDVGMTHAVINELKEGRMMKLFQAVKEQRLAASVGHVRRMMQHGEVKFSVHPQFYHYWGQRLGYQCWDDPAFVREFLRDNPECRVKNVSQKIMTGWRPESRNVRFHKAYAL